MRYPTFFEGTKPAARRFCLYAAGGRIYAQDDRSCLIDIGEYERSDDGFAYRMPGDSRMAGDGFAGADDVLRDLAGRIDSSFLDIRFRSLPDHSEDYSLDLRRAAHRELQLPVTAHNDAPAAGVRSFAKPAQTGVRAPALAGR